jgi:methyltransferase (TIGR00027 family)
LIGEPPGQRQASRTAVGVAILRLAHQLIDGQPRILEDPASVALAGPEVVAAVRERADEFRTPGALGLRAHVLLRSRYAEDCLAEAVQRGVPQYVILGAGGDTFGYRQPAWARELLVIEVDHPGSQSQKRDRLTAAGLEIPGNVRFAAVDFETVSLARGLEAAGMDSTRSAFFSWLGVTMYLTEDAVDAVLGFVASMPQGSEIVFTFAQRPSGAREDAGRRRLAEQAAEVGEPWLTYFDPASLEHKLRGFGYADVSFLSPEEARSRYFEHRADGLSAPRRSSICRARV